MTECVCCLRQINSLLSCVIQMHVAIIVIKGMFSINMQAKHKYNNYRMDTFEYFDRQETMIKYGLLHVNCQLLVATC